MDSHFGERLLKAATQAKVPYSQTAIGALVGANKQTVQTWMDGGLPKANMLFSLADAFGVDPRWLASGIGDMVPKVTIPGLTPAEQDLIDRYRMADPRWRLSLTLLSFVATEDQQELAGDVNIILARVFGKKAKDIKPVSNARVAAAYKDAPHVVARKAKERR